MKDAAPGHSEKRWLRVFPVAVVMGSIFFLSHQPGGSFRLPKVTHIDKVLHCLMYAVLGLSACFALPPRFRQQRPIFSMSVVVLFCLFYGISDELHQYFIPGRSCDVFDVLADVSGGALAVICWQGWQRKMNAGAVLRSGK